MEKVRIGEAARKGAFRVLSKLREEGVIKAWGLGVNRVEPTIKLPSNTLVIEADLSRPTSA